MMISKPSKRPLTHMKIINYTSNKITGVDYAYMIGFNIFYLYIYTCMYCTF